MIRCKYIFWQNVRLLPSATSHTVEYQLVQLPTLTVH